MVERPVAPWEQLRPSQIFDTTALYAPLNELGSILPAAQFRLPSAIGIRCVSTLRYFPGAIEDCTDRHGDITLRHGIYAAAQSEMALRVIKGLAARLAAREWVPLLDKLLGTALYSLNLPFISNLRLARIFSQALGRQWTHHCVPTSHRANKVDRFTEESTVWIHQNPPSLLSSSFVINPRLRSQHAPPSSTQMDRTGALYSTTF